MFHRCKYLKELKLFSFDINNVIDMSHMFSYSENLNNLDLSTFNLKSITNMSYMFYNCYNLKKLNLPNLKNKNKINMFKIVVFSVYFIENHITTSTPTMSLTGDSGGLFSNLKKEKEAIYSEPGKSEQFLYTIFSFEIYPAKIKDRYKDELNIKLILENKNEKFVKKLTITNFEKNNYIYDLEFQPKGFIRKINPPKSHKFPRRIQFEIYRDYLEKDLGIRKNTNKRREDLVFFTQKLFDEKFMFNFYIIFFLESLCTKNFRRHFNYFNDQKIEGIGELGNNQKLATNYVSSVKFNSGHIFFKKF